MKALIEKYFNGSTTNAEEKAIFNYFASGNHDPELEEYKKYFRYMASFKLHAREIIPKEDYVEPVKDSNRKAKPLKRRGMYLRIGIALSVAASLALLILFFPLWNTNNNFVVVSGKKYADKEHTRLGIHTALNNVQLDTKPMFDDLDTHLLN